MAPTRTNSDDDNRHAVPSLEEIIFSCGICQATVSELYPAHENHPASHAADDDDGMGIKLWIGNCVHVFCGRHVEGGGQFTHRLGGIRLLVRSLANAFSSRCPFPFEQRSTAGRMPGVCAIREQPRRPESIWHSRFDARQNGSSNPQHLRQVSARLTRWQRCWCGSLTRMSFERN